MIARRLLANAPLQIVQAVLGFATIAVFTRLMGADQYGRYALVLAASMAAHTLALTWAEAAAFRFRGAVKTPQDEADHFATLRLMLGAAFVVILGAFALAAFAAPAMMRLAILFAIGAAFFRFLTRVMRETERAEGAVGAFVAAECAYLVIGFGLGAALLFATPLGAAAPFCGLLIAAMGLALRDAPHLLRRARGGRARHLAAYARYGVPLALALALDLVVQAGVRFILADTRGAAEAGAYAAAFGLTRPLDIVFAWFGTACAPLLLTAYEQDGPAAARRAAIAPVTLLIALAAPAACGLALVAQPLAMLVVGESLSASAAAVAPWLALSGVLSGLALYYFSEAFQLARKTLTRASLMLAPATAQVALTVWLAPAHGAVGAAIAAALSAGVACCLLALVGRRWLALPLPAISMVKIVLATGLMAALVSLAPTPALPLAALATKAALGALVYALAAFALDIGGVRAVLSAVLQPLARRLTPLQAG